MRTVKIVLSISFLFLAAAVVAGDTEISNELPDEIKNLDEKKILKPKRYYLLNYPNQVSNISTKTIVWVKIKLNKRGEVDTADVVYCENPNIGFEESALESVKKRIFSPVIRRRKVDRSWFYTRVEFDPRKKILSTAFDCDEENATLPKILIKSRPKYPSIARQTGIDAKVWVRVLVGIDGRPLDVVIQETTDPGWKYGFNEEALKGARKCRFKPAICDGNPVRVWVSFPFVFIFGR